jgi:hypothetical protein
MLFLQKIYFTKRLAEQLSYELQNRIFLLEIGFLCLPESWPEGKYSSACTRPTTLRLKFFLDTSVVLIYIVPLGLG